MVNGSYRIKRLYRKVQPPSLTSKLEQLALQAGLYLKMAPHYIKYAANYSTDPDENSVIPSMIIFYMLCALNGWYNSFIAVVPTQVLEDSITPLQYDVFVRVTLTAPIITMVGMCLRGKWAYFGAIMQLTGNLGVAGVLWTFIAAIGYTQYWGQGNFAGTWVLAAAVGAVVFCIRDLRRLFDRDRWEVQ